MPLAEPSVESKVLADGVLKLSSPIRIAPNPGTLADLFIKWCEQYQPRVAIAEKDATGQFVALTYGDAILQARAVAAQLIALGGGQGTPLIILSGASRAHFVLIWGAILAGVPYVPVSGNYARVPAAFGKLKAVFDKTKPRFVWSENYDPQREGLIATGLSDAPLIWLGVDAPRHSIALDFESEGEAFESVDRRILTLNHDIIARYMFTSGSTGSPKGVIHTHGMIMTMLAARAALGEDEPDAAPPRVLDWMPWSHVGAGVLRMAFVMNAGGSIYIDDGKPVPGEFEKTLANLAVVKPTSYAGAPLGWNMLVEALEQDDALAKTFFGHVVSLAYGSAAMPESTYERLQALLVKYQGARRAMSTSLMSTEVAVGLSRYWPCEDQTVVGLPMPGAEFKLLPVGDRYEVRVKSDGVTPGYLNDPDKTRAAFDEDGFFKMGDAVTFADPKRPEAGLRFAGRIAEQFKLVTGTWVSAGTLRAQLVAACAPWVRDVVICGINEGFIAALIWPNLSACTQLVAGVEADVFTSDAVMAKIRAGLAAHNAQNPASSQSIKRFSLLTTPPSIGDGEITEKGYVNQGLVQRLRADDVALLFGENHPRVMDV
ncbi:MAG: AMP-binding protein [Gammaproteobacteria bacterium]|nr:AMP-binding protein [Gammaproteobacteria bacterium]